MLRKTIALLIFSSFAAASMLNAEDAPSSKKKATTKTKKETTALITPAKPLPQGWSLVDGVWMHSDGYKFVQGRIIRNGAPSSKRPPNPPTQAQIDAVTKKKKAPTAAELSAAKAAERERNLRPAPAPRMGSHL
jgi:hypothetical protein